MVNRYLIVHVLLIMVDNVVGLQGTESEWLELTKRMLFPQKQLEPVGDLNDV